MWELISNGLNIFGNLASVGSFISSFSVDKNTKAFKDAVIGIEKRLGDFNSLFIDTNRPNYLEEYLEQFESRDNNQKIHTNDILRFLQIQHSHNIKSQEKLIMSLSDMISEIKNSYNFSSNQQQISNKNLYKNLLSNPFDVGVSQFWDISSVNSYDQFPNKIISNLSSPILWTNPILGNRYIGEMNNNLLSNLGININVPHYNYHQDGFIYNAKSGLYLPELLIVR